MVSLVLVPEYKDKQYTSVDAVRASQQCHPEWL